MSRRSAIRHGEVLLLPVERVPEGMREKVGECIVGHSESGDLYVDLDTSVRGLVKGWGPCPCPRLNAVRQTGWFPRQRAIEFVEGRVGLLRVSIEVSSSRRGA